MADVFEQFLALSHGERVQAGKRAASEILGYCQSQGLNDKDSLAFFCSVTRLFVSVDRSCEQGEYDLFVDVTGFEISPQEFFELTNHGADPEFVKAMRELIASMSEEARTAVAVFGACICSADGDVNSEERRMIASIL